MSDTTVTPVYFEQTARSERRLDPRSKMTEIVYMNMQAENGGILLDISASGLSFQMASPIATEREISFRLSAEGIEDVEILAQVAWLDDDRKRGGLRFGQLPEKVRIRIQRWAGIPVTPVAASPDRVTQTAAKPPIQKQQSKSNQAGRSLISEMNPYSVTREHPHMGAQSGPVSGRPLEGLPNPLRANSSFRPLISPEPQPETAHRRRHFGSIASSIFLLLIVAAGVFVFNNKREAGQSLILLGEKLIGEYPRHSTDPPRPPAAAPSPVISRDLSESATNLPPASDPSSSQTPSSANPTDSASAAGNGNEEAKPPATPSNATHRSKTTDASGFPQRSPMATTPAKSGQRSSDEGLREDDGHTELALARQYLRGTNVPKDRDMAAHLLWVAVGEGNPQAELELADLYLRNDGVPLKNCAQARILLNDSSNSGNVEATQQLAKLRDYGCR